MWLLYIILRNVIKPFCYGIGGISEHYRLAVIREQDFYLGRVQLRAVDRERWYYMEFSPNFFSQATETSKFSWKAHFD